MSGTASMRWVRPIFTIPAKACALSSSASRRARTDGVRTWVICSTAAMCMAVGKVSLDDCDMLTWSLGWTGVFDPWTPPASSMARLEMTSLAFMLVWVPLPVCHTRRGKWSSRVPSVTSAAACEMSSASFGSNRPRSALVRAEASLRIPMARITGRGIVSCPDGEVDERARRLGPPVTVGGHLDGAHRVGLGPGGRHGTTSILRNYPHSTWARIEAPSSLTQPLERA